MLNRQKILLDLIYRSGGSMTRLHLVKLAFLFSQVANGKKDNNFYQFVPYKHGPFSFTLYHEINSLISKGQLSEIPEKTLRVRNNFTKETLDLDQKLDREIQLFINNYRNIPLNNLINLVYQEYPWFTLNSEKTNNRFVEYPIVECAIFTMGYQGWQVDGFLNYIMQKGVRMVIDVRNNPVSRSYGFHKKTLSRLCTNVGVEYTHFPMLGIKPEMRTNLDSNSDYVHLFSLYEKMVDQNKEQLANVAALVEEKPSVLMCMESDFSICHRSRLAIKVKDIIRLPIVNI